MTKYVPPPPTRFGSVSAAQAKPAASVGVAPRIAPPPTRFGAAAAQAKPVVPTLQAPPRPVPPARPVAVPPLAHRVVQRMEIEDLEDIKVKDANALLSGKKRAPTLYTYIHKKLHQKITSTPQGPHTVSNKFLSYMVQGNYDASNINDLFYGQVPKPSDVKDIIDNEGVSGTIALQLDRYRRDYKVLYFFTKKQVDQLSKDYRNGDDIPDSRVKRVKSLIVRLLNLHPYATYAWKTTKAASKRATRGKGEAKHVRGIFSKDKTERLTSARGLIDKPKVAFGDMASFKEFLENRLGLYLPSSEAQSVVKKL